jgi:hypothetical protein
MIPTRPPWEWTSRRNAESEERLSAPGIVGKRSINPDHDSFIVAQTGNRLEDLVVIRACSDIDETNFLPTRFETDQTGVCKIARPREIDPDNPHLYLTMWIHTAALRCASLVHRTASLVPI